MMWHNMDPYDWLNKFYSCYMATVVGIVNGCGLGIDALDNYRIAQKFDGGKV